MNKMKGTVKESQSYVINIPKLDNDEDEETFISFPSFEEFCKLAFIELLFKKIEKVKNDKKRVRKYLKKIKENVDECEYMMIITNSEEGFQNLLKFTYVFLCIMKINEKSYEYEKDLQEEIYNSFKEKIRFSTPSSIIIK